MRIEDLRLNRSDGTIRASAMLHWEDCARGQEEVFFELVSSGDRELRANPHSFLAATLAPALYYGEQRIIIGEEVCPEFMQNLRSAAQILGFWNGHEQGAIPQIEAPISSTEQSPPADRKAAFFLSGGIDSFATLQRNRNAIPLTHPSSIKDGIIVYGFEMDDPVAFEYMKLHVGPVASKVGIEVAFIHTNIYLLYRDEDHANHFKFWTDYYMGGAFAAVSHALIDNYHTISLAAGHDLHSLWEASGSHPILDPNYSSYGLRYRHDGIELNRFEKTALVAQNEVYLQHLRVCNMYRGYQEDQLNCGKCEKCVRTMLALLALGKLEKASAFPVSEVTADMVRSCGTIHHPIVEQSYVEMLEPLERIGRHDLTAAIKSKIADFRLSKSPYRHARRLGSKVGRMFRTLRSSPVQNSQG